MPVCILCFFSQVRSVCEFVARCVMFPSAFFLSACYYINITINRERSTLKLGNKHGDRVCIEWSQSLATLEGIVHTKVSIQKSRSLDVCVCVCVCVLSPHLFWTSDLWTHQPRSHRKVTQISPPSFCGACLHFYREKDSAIYFPRRREVKVCVPTNPSS